MTIWLILYIFLLCATILDCHSGRVPNILISTVLLIGVVWYGSSSCQELFFFVVRVIGFSLPFMFLFFTRMLGGGDVKLIAVIGGLVGVRDGVIIIFLGFFIAAIIAFIRMIRFGILRERIHVFIRYVERIYYGKKIILYPVSKNSQYHRVRLSLFFLLGACIYQITIRRFF